jgi:hypothetical protein
MICSPIFSCEYAFLAILSDALSVIPPLNVLFRIKEVDE